MKILLILLAASIVALLLRTYGSPFSFSGKDQLSTHNERREAPEMSEVKAARDAPTELQFENLYDAICTLGYPVFVNGREGLDRFVHFDGPFFVFGHNPDLETKPYGYLAVESLDSGDVVTTMLYEEHQLSFQRDPAKENAEDLLKLQLPMIKEAPTTEQGLIRAFGPWKAEHNRAGDAKRVVYDKRICFGGKAYVGVYVEIDDGKVKRMRAITNNRRLFRIEHDLRSYKEDNASYQIEPHMNSIGEYPVVRDGAVDTVLNYVISKELGEWEEALKFVGHELDYEAREREVQPTKPGVTLDGATLKYRITQVESDQIHVLVSYSLQDQTPIETIYTASMKDNEWKVVL